MPMSTALNDPKIALNGTTVFFFRVCLAYSRAYLCHVTPAPFSLFPE